MPRDDRRAFWSRKPERCWANACTQPASPLRDARWRGHYCQDCQHRLAEDAARIDEEEETR